MTEKKFQIEGMSCHHCVKAIEVELEDLGVDSFEVKVGFANVKYDETSISENEIINAINESGFKVV